MFESFTSNPTAAESLLGQIAGPTQAAAIMGDLDELATTRGRLWFWTAYMRALVSLAWRAMVPFAAGIAGFCLMMYLFGLWMRAPKEALGPPSAREFTFLSTAFLAIFSSTLWFAAPYAMLRFGRRDRVAQLSGFFLLLTAPSLLGRNAISLACAVLTLVLMVAALFSSIWRRPMVVLAVTSVTVLIGLEASADLVAKIYHPQSYGWTSWSIVRFASAVALAIAAIVFTCLRSLLVRERRPAIV